MTTGVRFLPSHHRQASGTVRLRKKHGTRTQTREFFDLEGSFAPARLVTLAGAASRRRRRDGHRLRARARHRSRRAARRATRRLSRGGRAPRVARHAPTASIARHGGRASARPLRGRRRGPRRRDISGVVPRARVRARRGRRGVRGGALREFSGARGGARAFGRVRLGRGVAAGVRGRSFVRGAPRREARNGRVRASL